MSKITARHVQKQREKKNARQAEKLKAHNKPTDVKIRERMTREKLLDQKFVASGDFFFWLCHGANYLNSDYSTGKWEPLYPDIYHGMIETDLQKIFVQVGDRYFPGGKPSDARGPKILSWLMANVRLVRTTAKRLARFTDGLRNPHNPKVWEFFNNLEASIALMLKKQAEETRESHQVPEAG